MYLSILTGGDTNQPEPGCTGGKSKSLNIDKGTFDYWLMLLIIKCITFTGTDIYGCSCRGSDGELKLEWWSPDIQGIMLEDVYSKEKEKTTEKRLMSCTKTPRWHYHRCTSVAELKIVKKGGVSRGNYSHCAKISPPGVSFSLPLSVSLPRAIVLRQLILDFSFGNPLSQPGGYLSLANDTVQLVRVQHRQQSHKDTRL